MKYDDKTKRPVKPSYEDIMFSEAGSANDCTGLIPSAVTTDSEYASYEELMDFNIPKMYFEDDE